jgi:hypothetical protein
MSNESNEPPGVSGSFSHPVFPKDAKLSEQLAYLHTVFAHKPMQVRDMIGVLGEHAPLLLIILLALPFAIPWPLPLSIPFGIAIVFVASALLRGRPPRFSEKILNAKFPAGVHDKLVRFSKRIVIWLERWLRPGRWSFMFGRKYRERLQILGLLLAALFLASPLPFSNFIPAWAIILVAAGLLGRDGLFVMTGHLLFLISLLCLALLSTGVIVTFDVIKDWIGGLF